MRILFLGLAALTAVTATPSFGDDAASVCSGILDTAAKNISINTGSSDVLNTIYDQFCDASSKTKKSGLDVGVDAVIKAIPVKFTLGSSNSSVAMTNFCGSYSSVYSSSSRTSSYQSTVVEKALETMLDCVKFAKSGNHIHHRILNDEAVDIYMQSAVGSKLTVQGVSTSENIGCSANAGEGDKKTFDQTTQYTFSGYMTLNCHRHKVEPTGDDKPAMSPPRETNYAEGTVSVSTSAGPYAVFVPQSARLAQQEAEQIQKSLTELKATLTATNNDLTATNHQLKGLHLECTSIQTQGQSANCPAQYLVTGCTAGNNHASTDLGVNRATNGCYTHINGGWTIARCCRVIF